ncbi:CocE/NonD family hydrolase [Streptomyces sp. NPDC054796]
MRKGPTATRAAIALVTTIALTGTLATVAVATSDGTDGADGQAVATATDAVTHEENERVPEGARWTQHYFPSSDGSGTELHADVLRPEKLPEGKKTPVIMAASSYFGHSGQTDEEGWKQPGPSDRFEDFIKGTDLFKKGYSFVMVDTRGFGGSSGCFDLGGPGDQADVKAAIDWSAKQPWSSGSVGMYGKSFDAWTGLLGNNTKHDALKAVVAQEPIWDLNEHFHSNGIPRPHGVQAPITYYDIATLPQLPKDDERYRKNAAYEKKHPECAASATLPSIGDPEDRYWKDRSPAGNAKGTDTPLFFTQGLLEHNTKPLGMRKFLDNHSGEERGWVGPWDHVRGNEKTADGRLAMGREGWFKETMAFYDEHLKGAEPKNRAPDFAVEDNTGKWRAEKSWPATDRTADLRLGNGSYVDKGAGSDTKGPGEGADSTASFFVWSKPLEKATRVSGTPKVSMTAEGEGNVMVKLYDVAEDGTAVMFDEQVSRLDRDHLDLDLKTTDWTLKSGHRLAVEIGSVQTGEWLDTPSKQKVTIQDARLALPLDDPSADTRTDGDRSPYLDVYTKANTAKLKPGPATIKLPPVGGRD